MSYKQNWKLTLEYDGSKYSGWAEQKNARTVMGALREAVEQVLRQHVEIGGAGRTDAGVHARAQVAHLRLPRPAGLPPRPLLRELNAALPADIVIVDLEAVALDFHARHSALSRAYVYQIATRKTAFDKKYVWWVKEDLDLPAMQRAATLLTGRHDFRNFQAQDPARPKESSIVVVEKSFFEASPAGDRLYYHVEASHFLWRMVRRLVGCLVKVGLHELQEEDFAALLRAKAPTHIDVAAWTAPASGLFLNAVRYRA